VAGTECLLLAYTETRAERKQVAEASRQGWCFVACQFAYL